MTGDDAVIDAAVRRTIVEFGPPAVYAAAMRVLGYPATLITTLGELVDLRCALTQP